MSWLPCQKVSRVSCILNPQIHSKNRKSREGGFQPCVETDSKKPSLLRCVVNQQFLHERKRKFNCNACSGYRCKKDRITAKGLESFRSGLGFFFFFNSFIYYIPTIVSPPSSLPSPFLPSSISFQKGAYQPNTVCQVTLRPGTSPVKAGGVTHSVGGESRPGSYSQFLV